MSNVQEVKSFAEFIVGTIKDSIAYQENPANRIITECEFYVPDDNHLEIWIRSNCNGWCEDVKVLKHLTNNNITLNSFTFITNDFIGLSEKDANKMIESNNWKWMLAPIEVDEELPF